MSTRDIDKEIESIHVKLDRILDQLQKITERPPGSKRPSPKPKPPALTAEEIPKFQERFNSLYERWLSGNEHEVQEELEQLDVDELRRLSDANNLNVTSRMPKQKVLELIAARFREKRQLHRGVSLRSNNGT